MTDHPPISAEAQRIEEIRKRLAEVDAAQTAFDAVRIPWAKNKYEPPMPEGYFDLVARTTAADEAIEEGAIGIVRDLLSALDASRAELVTRTNDAQCRVIDALVAWDRENERRRDAEEERDALAAANAEAKETGLNIMVEVGPLVSDAAIVGRTYGWPEVFGIVLALKRAHLALAAEVRTLRAEQAWQPIETGPEDEVAWVALPDGRVERSFYVQDKRGGWYWCDADDGTKLKPQPTHWYPYAKPAPPSVPARKETR